MENKRLTKKIIEKNVDGYVLNHREDFTENTYEVIQKLGKLEDLEEELGCPLEVLVKALTNGVYVIDEETKEFQWILRGLHTFTGEGLGTSAGFSDDRIWRKKVNKAGIEFSPNYFWNDYKKTWWLKEDRSE